MSLLVSNRPFRLFFTAAAASNLGDGIALLALPWLATLLTRDPLLIASVTVAAQLPWLLFSIPAGVLTDRADRRLLMVRADLMRLGLMVGVIALILSVPALPPADGAAYVLVLAAIAFLLGSAEVVRDNTAQTMLPQIVGKAALERANGTLWSVEHVMGAFVGPPLAGALIALAVPAPFALDALCYGLAAWCVWCLRLPPRPVPLAPHPALRAALSEGWAWLRSHVVMLRLAIMLGLINALSTMAMTILVLMSQEVYGLDAVGHGLLLTAGAAGGVAGGLLGPRLIARIGAQRAVMAAMALFPLPLLALGLANSAWLAAPALFLETFAALLWNIVTVSYRQRHIPDALLGRVNSLYRFFGWGMMPVGALLGGALVALAEPGLGRETALRLPFLIGAAGMAGIAVYGAARLRL